jgi:hypothetical protein
VPDAQRPLWAAFDDGWRMGAMAMEHAIMDPHDEDADCEICRRIDHAAREHKALIDA